ncbi:MAG TPA: porin, partial [Kofleriaceae bacterium]|nr:porin [Kofleriaceae bacterium]
MSTHLPFARAPRLPRGLAAITFGILCGVTFTAASAVADEDIDDVEPEPATQPRRAEPASKGEGDDADDAGADAGEPGGGASRGHRPGGGKASKAEPSPLRIGGRVFARLEAADTDATDWTGQFTLASARLGVSYRWKDRLRVKAVLEAAGKVAVRDAFIELAAGSGVDVRAGRFKGPVSAIERASAWVLPTIDRGAIADVLEDGIGLTGRRDGIEVRFSGGKRRPRFSAVLSQSVATTGDDPARPLADGAGVSAALRGELPLCQGITLGVTGSNREVNYVADVARFWAGGVDAEIDLGAAGLGLRLWADALVGQSHLAAASATDPTTFVAGQLVAGWRLGGADKGKRYLEPYLLGAYLNPDTGHRRDHLTDLTVGVAGGRWKRWRVQAQVSLVSTWSKRPAALGGFGVDVDDRMAASLQLGAAF